MDEKRVRNIVKIDEEKCDGCGTCVPACAEGALKIIDGKARLVSEVYCDGLGACLGECPQGAITIEERPAEEFDEEAAKAYLEKEKNREEKLPCGCSSAMVTEIKKPKTDEIGTDTSESQPSMLGHWPVQLTLVPPQAPFLREADVLLVADCVPFAYAGFHRDFLINRVALVACPKLDDFQSHLTKLTEILRQSSIRSLTVVHMEVPCCSGLTNMVTQALQQSGRNDLPFQEVTIGMNGCIIK